MHYWLTFSGCKHGRDRPLHPRIYGAHPVYLTLLWIPLLYLRTGIQHFIGRMSLLHPQRFRFAPDMLLFVRFKVHD